MLAHDKLIKIGWEFNKGKLVPHVISYTKGSSYIDVNTDRLDLTTNLDINENYAYILFKLLIELKEER